MKRSRLSEIPGLGPKRVKELLAHFRSIDAIQLATPEQIAAAPGVGPALARQVWEYFHPPLEGEICGEEERGAPSEPERKNQLVPGG